MAGMAAGTAPETTTTQALDGRTLRSALGHFATGVTIVTGIGTRGRPVGVTANSFASVSLDPPLVSWSLSRESPNLATFREGGRFAINILSEDQQSLSARFARPVEDKFASVPWFPGTTGCPILPDGLAWFDCRVHASHDVGDHVIFIGRVVAFEERGGAPLVFFGGRYLSAPDLYEPDLSEPPSVR
ncbi:flavin reductase family protein [Fodinicurvata sp. EGI_FJ10296]|uniref:flavin reductase family protein n=1 Tax=Fodinicurvata sp. EGI_FJ10296 TaxID=3231908 RepID=UPI00345418BB